MMMPTVPNRVSEYDSLRDSNVDLLMEDDAEEPHWHDLHGDVDMATDGGDEQYEEEKYVKEEVVVVEEDEEEDEDEDDDADEDNGK
jgi:hypothetical protein